ncbi:MAG: metal ABC transporter permease [Acidobacteria bacterium]|nr:metal ABC transporter permease [Acidobacteriota bacterium]
MNILELMAAPFVECLVLVAIHTYLGIHVLKRRVIFVDLALAQIAALGSTVGFLFGIMPDTTGALLFSIAFTFIGAAVFAVTRFRHERVPQEAIIGLTYAVSCAVAILVIEKTRGAEHLKDILVGNLLWVTWSDVALAAAVYLGIGGIHFFLRKKFLMISDDPENARLMGLQVGVWDFVFYLTFGVVISLSTRVAGVLLVFVFLVAPAILAFSLTQRMSTQLLIGWGTGTIVTTVGLYLSWAADLPSGPAVIAFYGVALVLAGIVIFLVRAEDRKRAWRLFAAGIAMVFLVAAALWFVGTWIASSTIAVSEEAQLVEQDLGRDRSVAIERDAQEREIQHRLLSDRVGFCVATSRITEYLDRAGPEARIEYIRIQLNAEPRKGLEYLVIALADDDMAVLYREELVQILKETTGRKFGFDPQLDYAANAPSIKRICRHLRSFPRVRRGTGSL